MVKSRVGVRRRIVALSVIAGLVGFIPMSPAGADGTETLGTPSIPIAQGSGLVTAGVGMHSREPEAVSITVPVNALVKQVLLYWEGYSRDFAPDNTIRINGTEVTGTVIGGPTVFFNHGGDVKSTSFRADITRLNKIHPGPNTVTLSDLAFDYAVDGASLAVIYDDGTAPADIQVRDGNDNAWRDFQPPTNRTVPQTFVVSPAAAGRVAELTVMVGGVESGRSSITRVTVGDVVTDHANLLGDTDGPQWDDVTIPVAIPAGVTTVTVELLSQGPGNPASLSWVAAMLEVAGTRPTCPPPSNTPAVTHGSAYGVDVVLLNGKLINKLGQVSTVAPGTPADKSSAFLTASVTGLVSATVLGNTSTSSLNPLSSTATSTVVDLSLLGGLVKSSTLRAVSQSTASQNASSYNSDGSTIEGLTVNNKSVNVAPNTKVIVKDVLNTSLAELYVYEESGSSTFAGGVSKANHSVNMLRLVLLKPFLGHAVGTEIVVAHAQSDAQGPTSGCPTERSVSGEAFTAFANGTLGTKQLVNVKVGDAVLPSTGGADFDGTIVNIPGVAMSATAANSTSGSLVPNPHAASRSVVENANVLGGLVTAKVLDVRSSSSANGTTAATTFGATFVDLKVGGVAVSADVSPNTTIFVNLGAGTYASVVINERMSAGNGTTDTEGTINAVHVRVYALSGLLTGEVIISSAHSDAHV